MVYNDEQLTRRAEDVEKAGRDKFGNLIWPEMVGALGRAGIVGEPIAQVIQTPDAVDRIARATREALLNEMSSTDTGISRNAERTYLDLRDAEREQYRKMKGRR